MLRLAPLVLLALPGLASAQSVNPEFAINTFEAYCNAAGVAEMTFQVINYGLGAGAPWADLFYGLPAPPAPGTHAEPGRRRLLDSIPPMQQHTYTVLLPNAPDGGVWMDLLLDTDHLWKEVDKTDNAAWFYADFSACP